MTGTPGPETVRQQVSGGFAAAADGYDTTGTEFFSVLGEHLVNHAQIPAGARVLDVGCGKGAVSIPAARAAGPHGHVTGIDLAPVMLAYAGDRARHVGLSNVTFQAEDAEDLAASGRWGPGSFDVILAGNAIQFLPQPERAVRAWHELLTPTGRLGISWSLAEDPRWLRAIATFDTALPAQVTGFKALLRRPPFSCEDELEALLTDAGFHVPATVLHRITMTYRTPQQWWQAASSQGPWAVAWRHIPPARLPDAQRQAFALLDQLREPDGTLTRTITFACTSARSADPGAGR